jgi:hypothetical protein
LPEFETEQDAAQALFEAIVEDGNARSDVQQIEDTTASLKAEQNKPVDAPNEQVTPPVEEQPTESDSFARTDLAALLEGVDDPLAAQRITDAYKAFQGDYTRSKQQLAEQARQYAALDEIGGVDVARDAVQFVTALSTDPTYALQVHEQLTQALTSAGMTPAAASAEASRQIDEAVTPAGEEYYGEVDPAIERQLSSVQSELEAMRAWREQQEEKQYQISLANELDRQAAVVAHRYPQFSDEAHMAHIYGLAYSTGGNLEQAAEIYKSMRDQTLEEYISQKASVTASAPAEIPTGASNAEEPTSFSDLYDPRLEKLVNERLAQAAAVGDI